MGIKNVESDARVRAAAKELKKAQDDLTGKIKELVAYNEKYGNKGATGLPYYEIDMMTFWNPEEKKGAEKLLAEVRTLEEIAGKASGALAVAEQVVGKEIREAAKPEYVAIQNEYKSIFVNLQAVRESEVKLLNQLSASGCKNLPAAFDLPAFVRQTIWAQAGGCSFENTVEQHFSNRSL